MKASAAIALCLALSLALSPRSEAAPILTLGGTIVFDPDGAAAGLGPVSLSALSFNPGNLLAVGAIPAYQDWVNSGGTLITPFDTIVQTSINSTTAGNPFSLPAGAEITMVMRAQEEILNVAGTGPIVTTAVFSPGGANLLDLYYDPTPDASDATGTGFNDGQLILAAGVTTNCTGAGGINIPTQSTVTNNLTNSGPLDGAGVGATPTYGLSGPAVFCANPIFVDSAFFVTTPITVLFSTTLSAPFTAGIASPMLDGVPSNIGTTNGLSGPDILLESNSELTFAVPEPSSISLVVLVLLCFFARSALSPPRNRRCTSQQAHRLRATV